MESPTPTLARGQSNLFPGNCQPPLECTARRGTPPPFSPDVGRPSVVSPHLVILYLRGHTEAHKPKGSGCMFTLSPGFSGVTTCPHMLSLLRTFTLTHGLYQTPALTHSHTVLTLFPKDTLHKLTLKTDITHTETPGPHNHTRRYRLVRKNTPDTPPPSCPSMPSPSHTVGRGSTSLHPRPAHSLLHSCCRRVHHLWGRPAPRKPAHTYGKLPKVASLPSPSARGEPLSGYQEVNEESQGGRSSPPPVR